MIPIVIGVSAFMVFCILCFALVSANTDMHEDDYLQEQYLKEWKKQHDNRQALSSRNKNTGENK